MNAFRIGWQPKWNAERFLGSMEEEIRAVEEQGESFKSTIYNSILTPEGNEEATVIWCLVPGLLSA